MHGHFTIVSQEEWSAFVKRSALAVFRPIESRTKFEFLSDQSAFVASQSASHSWRLLVILKVIIKVKLVGITYTYRQAAYS